MEYLKKSFSVAMGGKDFGDGWDRIFGKKEPPPKLDADGRCTRDGCYFCRGSGDWTKCPDVQAASVEP